MLGREIILIILVSPTLEILTTSFSLNVEYDLLIKDESSSFEIKSAENRLMISVDNAL